MASGFQIAGLAGLIITGTLLGAPALIAAVSLVAIYVGIAMES